MGKSSSPSVEKPDYAKPTPTGANIPGFGKSVLQNSIWNFMEDPQQGIYRSLIEGLRNSILEGIGVTSPQREASRRKWQETQSKESLRTALPQLENTLFERGMGGSKLYQDSITDLINKANTQAFLGAEDLAARDEALKLQQLASIGGLNQQNLANMMGLTQGSQNADLKQQELAQSMYLNSLPYNSQVNAGSSPMDRIFGAGTGALGGLGAGMGLSGLATAGGMLPAVLPAAFAAPWLTPALMVAGGALGGAFSGK